MIELILSTLNILALLLIAGVITVVVYTVKNWQ
jgi:hypothetical protein